MMDSNSNEDLEVCRVCLDTDTKLLDVNKYGLSRMFMAVSGIQMTPTDGLPQYICIFCWKLLQNASDLIDKCRNTQELLSNCLLQVQCLTTSHLKTIDRTKFKLPLTAAEVCIDCCPEDDVIEIKLDDVKTEPVADFSCNDVEYYDENTTNDIENSCDERHVKEDSDDCNTHDIIKTIDRTKLIVPLTASEVRIDYPEDDVIETKLIDIKTESVADFSSVDVEYYDENTTHDIENSSDERNVKEDSDDCNTHDIVEENKLSSVRRTVNEKTSRKRSREKGTEGPNVVIGEKQDKTKEGLRKNKGLSKSKSKEFIEKYLRNIHKYKRVFYEYISEKYIEKTKDRKTSKLPPFDIVLLDEIVSAPEPDFNFDTIQKPELSNLNENQEKLYQYIEDKYKTATVEDGRKIITDISDMRIKKSDLKAYTKYRRVKVTDIARTTEKTNAKKRTGVSKEALASLAETCQVDVILLDKEQQIEDLLSRKEKVYYQKADFKCELCFRGFTQLKTFQNHLAVHDESAGPLECDICHLRFQTRRKISKHMETTHTYKFICKLCSKVTRITSSAREHYKSHEGCQYPCEHCGKVFRKYNSRLEHTRIFHGSVRCDICQMGFVGAHGLMAHKIKAHREIFRCSGCGVQFHNADALKRHKDSAPDGCGPHVRPCTQCGESFPNEDSIKEHIPLCHSGRKKLKPSRSTLKLPSETKPEVKWVVKRECRVRGQNRLMCETCAADGFYSEATLRYHQRIHTGEKPYACSHCGKTFRIKESLAQHLRIHTGDRPYKCAHCSKAFKSASARYRHNAVHTKIKPYPCPQCGKRFSQQNSMKGHVRTVHFKLPPLYVSRARKKKQGKSDSMTSTGGCCFNEDRVKPDSQEGQSVD